MSAESGLSPLAEQLNSSIEQAAPEVAQMLSPLGRRLFFPKGILSQTAEAKAKAKRFNATIGIATEGDGPMYLPSMHAAIPGVKPADAFTYAPPAGRPGLRERWQQKLVDENPSLEGKRFSKPIVTSAITHGISLVGDLFVAAGDRIIMPDKLWGNYRLAYEVRQQAKITTYPFYTDDGFNVQGFANALAENARSRDKLVVVLNFPNNPTGYMPSVPEGQAIVTALRKQAEEGTKLVVVCDDAYFGLFYHLGGDSMTQSLFAQLCGLHPNLFAIKLDGATKELFAWGLRCGFITYGPGRPDTADALNEALDAKTRGAVRGSISNGPHVSQSLVEQALASESIAEERKQKRDLLAARAQKVFEVARDERFQSSWEVYPFNSGYFMLIKLRRVNAHQLREHLLEKHGVGLISTSDTDLRVAFSCLEEEEIQPLFETVHQGVQELA